MTVFLNSVYKNSKMSKQLAGYNCHQDLSYASSATVAITATISSFFLQRRFAGIKLHDLQAA